MEGHHRDRHDRGYNRREDTGNHVKYDRWGNIRNPLPSSSRYEERDSQANHDQLPSTSSNTYSRNLRYDRHEQRHRRQHHSYSRNETERSQRSRSPDRNASRPTESDQHEHQPGFFIDSVGSSREEDTNPSQSSRYSRDGSYQRDRRNVKDRKSRDEDRSARGNKDGSYEDPRRRHRSQEEPKSKSGSHDSKDHLSPEDAVGLEENDRDDRRSRSPIRREKQDSRPVIQRFDTEQLFIKPISWTRCFPGEPFYCPGEEGEEGMTAAPRLLDLHRVFETELLGRNERTRGTWTPFEFPTRKVKLKKHHCHHHHHSDEETSSSRQQGKDSDDDSCSSSDEEDDNDDQDNPLEELQRKKSHPWRLHEELWYNDPGEMNDGPVCRCSLKARQSGIRHGIYPGEELLQSCNPLSSNPLRLHHYRVVLTPLTNFATAFPTKIPYDSHDYIFEGFSLLSHFKLTDYPVCNLIRFNIEYKISLVEEKIPVNFTVKDLDLITEFIYKDVLELIDINWKASDDSNGCSRFHMFPRFSRLIEEDGKELLSPAVILQYLINSNKEVIDCSQELESLTDSDFDVQAVHARGMIAVCPGKKPCAVRIDQIDRTADESEKCQLPPEAVSLPVIVHFGNRPPQLSYAGNPEYQKAWKDYVKYRHLLANKPKVTPADRQALQQKEEKLIELRKKSELKKEVTIVVSAKGFFKTGLYCDVIQFALVIPVVVTHLRFHQSLAFLEESMGYKFKDRYLLQLALTHPSYRENFGTNPDHARNALSNCGIRQAIYGDKKVHYQHTRKRGILMLIEIMSQLGREKETSSNINHNERLEFLGDAVVEFLTSVHLYFMFPELQEGALATYRSAIVQNQHLAILAKKMQLERFMLYAHGSDLCHDSELRHAMANSFEALLGALFLDGGLEVTDKVFANALFQGEDKLLHVWVNYPKHPIQRQDPGGDRHYLEKFPRLQQLHKFEETIGVEFNHIRLLARAFTHRSVGYNILTLGSNQRMEFLGDTVLQLLASEYLYKFFPEHHEGHLSLLRSSLVNNKTQAVVCDDLGLADLASYNFPKGELKLKDRADLLEAFLGALFVDKGLLYCRTFCQVCFFPRLKDFIMSQEWNDPKSKLQQCCLTLRSSNAGDPDIPVYKVIETLGPTNTRDFVVAVKFRGERLATGKGHSIQEAEMDAARNALKEVYFPQLDRQMKVLRKRANNDWDLGKRKKRPFKQSQEH